MSSFGVFSLIGAVLLAVLGWLIKSLFDRVMQLLIPTIPKNSRLDKVTRWIREPLLSRRPEAAPSTNLDGVVASVKSLIETVPHLGIGSFASFEGTVTEFIVSQRSLLLYNTVNLTLFFVLTGIIILGFVIGAELGDFADFLQTRWLAKSPPWTQVIPSVMVGVIILGMVVGFFFFLAPRIIDFFPRVAQRLFPLEISLRTVFLSSMSDDRRRLMIAGGNYLPQEVSRATLYIHRRGETLRFYNLTGRIARRIRLRAVSKDIFRVFGETVSLRALADQLVEAHGLPLTVFDGAAQPGQHGASATTLVAASAA